MNEDAAKRNEGDTDDSSAGPVDVQAGLLERLREEVRTTRLVVVDDRDRERMVATLVDDVMELRLTLPGSLPGYRTSLLIFAVPEREDWSAGLGLQLWVDGDVAKELCWWGDEEDSDA